MRHIIYAVYYFFFFLELLFLSSKAMWVAIDCGSKNWVAVLKSFGSTVLNCVRLGYDILYSSSSIRPFRRSVLPPSSGYKAGGGMSLLNDGIHLPIYTVAH
jgi:hypothetical protein